MSEAGLTVEAVDPRSAQALELIAALSLELAERYDHADDGSGQFKAEDALAPRSAFLIGRLGLRAVACGAFRPLSHEVAEIKRMFVLAECRGRGFSRAILSELERRARKDGYLSVCLETAGRQPEAIALYERSGYTRIPKYGSYLESERSICFGKPL